MGGEFGSVLLVPDVIGIAVLLAVAVFSKPNQAATSGEFPLGPRRAALGHLGALAAFMLYSLAGSVGLGYPETDFARFIVGTPAVVLLVAIFGLPMLAMFSRLGLASFVGALVIALTFALLLAAAMYVVPHNEWCGSHFYECSLQVFSGSTFVAVPVALGFALGARLPPLMSKVRQRRANG